MRDQDNLDFLLARVCRAHYNLVRGLLEKTGLHRGQPPVLFALGHQDGLTHSELASMLEVTPATITNMVKRMEQAGFVERRRDPSDERVSRVYLTAAGRAVQTELHQLMKTAEVITFAGLTAEERDTLQRFLQQILENLQRHK